MLIGQLLLIHNGTHAPFDMGFERREFCSLHKCYRVYTVFFKVDCCNNLKAYTLNCVTTQMKFSLWGLFWDLLTSLHGKDK